MTRRIVWLKKALRSVKRLDVATRERIVSAVERFAETGHGDVKTLRGRQEEYRLRVGDWRVIFAIDTAGSMTILRVKPRGEAYR